MNGYTETDLFYKKETGDMSKICPETGEKVLYPECLECEDRYKCRCETPKKGEGDGKEQGR